MPYKRVRNGKIQWVVDIKSHGERITKIFKTKSEAIEYEVKIKKLIKAKLSTNLISLAKWAEKYLEYCKDRVTQFTWREKQKAFQFFFKGLSPDMPVQDITPNLVQKKLQEKREASTPYRANRDRANLSAAWNWGSRFLEGWPVEKPNPFILVPKFPWRKREKYVPPMEDLKKVMEAVSEEDRAMLLCFLHTGARRNEIFRLKWSDVDFANNLIWLTTRKRRGGMEERDAVPMTRQLREALLTHRMKYGQYEYVFVNKDGRPFARRNHWLPRLCKKIGVKPFNYHAIRHLTASWLDAHNVPLTTIQAVLRHKNATTTAIYLHELRGVKIALDEIFDDGNDQAGSKILSFKKRS